MTRATTISSTSKLDSSSLSPSPSQTPTLSQTLTNGFDDSSKGISDAGVEVPFKFSDLLLNGGIAGGVALIVTVSILYFIALRRRKHVSILTSSSTTLLKVQNNSFSVTNPLKRSQGQRPQAPLGKPPKSAQKSYAETVKGGKY